MTGGRLNNTIFTYKNCRLFDGFEQEWIETTHNTIMGIDKNCRIMLINQAYLQFARDNGGERIAADYNLGANMLDAISGPQREFYSEFFNNCFGANDVISHAYECSTPDRYRLFKLFVYPTPGRDALLLDHAIVVEHEHKHQSSSYSQEHYIDKDSLMHQCGYCRRVRHNNSRQWDWLESSFTYSNISHGLCESCLAHYYPNPENKNEK